MEIIHLRKKWNQIFGNELIGHSATSFFLI